ncbi:MAG: hypothetical protein A2541_01155 [Candidatus Taylorbacteria bacterium RIFOXYD2_FULL_36_9]|uniref:Uncharacterized protein n=1 Tax=Candidatus Taylorbacteria bacterium RIFOXYD2_FULL_36_9 TaxID=1802338 RepID=A0A1G2PF94_9BACT|nr:MAG: hypothetical protein A2541_01155 [Candidatus Taylorbacteria bacterium RIFOXYD2_FULL_36_9]
MNLFWYSYLSITVIIYLIEKWWYKRSKINLIIKTKYKILAIPVIVCLGYSLIIYFFYLNYNSLSGEIPVLIILATITILANYYYLLVVSMVKYLDSMLSNNQK